MPDLRLLTFNIWFSHVELPSRMATLAGLVRRLDPHMVALQEMTSIHQEELAKHQVWREYTWAPPPFGQRYYTLIGSRIPLLGGMMRQAFPTSGMGRDLLHCVAQPLGGQPIIFATSHMESLNEAQERRRQMDFVFQTLNETDFDVVFCGDTNINEGAVDGTVSLEQGWIDAWEALRPGELGATFDIERNTFIQRFDKWARTNHARLRFDRFWVRGRGGYTLVAVELVDDPVCSDHFGVLLSLRVVGEASACTFG